MRQDIPKQALIAAVRAAAGEAILPRFRALSAHEIAEKSGPADLVTIADTEAEAQIVARLARDWPEAVVLGEEMVAKDARLRDAMAEADPAVILDPVDGTWNFARGVSVFAVILAVARAGRPAWGMIYDPVWDDWVESDGGESWLVSSRGRQRLSTAPARPKRQMTGYFPQALYRGEPRRAAALAGLNYARLTSLRCAAHEYRLLAQGAVDFILSGPVPHPWDHAAGVLAVQGAGGVARFLDGEEYELGRRRGIVLSASSEEVWQQVADDFAGLAAAL